MILGLMVFRLDTVPLGRVVGGGLSRLLLGAVDAYGEYGAVAADGDVFVVVVVHGRARHRGGRQPNTRGIFLFGRHAGRPKVVQISFFT